MSIKDLSQKIKSYLANFKDQIWSREKGLKIKDDLYIVLLIILVGTASYGLGKISSFEKNKAPISVLKTKDYMLATVSNNSLTNNTKNTTASPSGLVVASKSGTKYYYPWCTGVSRIKEENKVWFNTIEEAKAVGLTPATNCTGLK
jgi:hypothetical protein